MERDQALEGQAPMSAGTTTLATVMKSAGYKTAMVGKWGLGSPLSESTPNKMGFDFYYRQHVSAHVSELLSALHVPQRRARVSRQSGNGPRRQTR